MPWIISTTSPDMIIEEEIWERVSSRGGVRTMRRIITWQWGHVVVDEEPTLEELNSDEGFEVDETLAFDRDSGVCWYIWQPVDKRTNRLVKEISELDDLIVALQGIGWRLVENNITMCGSLQKAKTRRRPKNRLSLSDYRQSTH